MKQLLFFMSVLFLFACKKAEDRECMKAAGKQTSLEVALPAFDKLHIGAKIEVVLVQSSEHKLVIHGRDNLIRHISFDLNEDGFLSLKNNNRCDFLRSYEKNKIKVEVHFTDLRELLFEGTFDLATSGTIHTSVFKLDIRDAGSTAYLNLNCDFAEINQGHGYGDFVLNGTADNATLRITSNGFGDASGFTVANELIVISNTPVSSKINADGAKTTVEIGGSGNVVYVGTPQSMNFIRYGTGQLVDGN